MKKTELEAIKRRDGRYAVRAPGGKFINGEEKTKFLLAKGLIKVSTPSAKPAADEAPAEES